MPDYHWTITTLDDGPIIADGLLGDGRPSLTRGSQPTLRFRFADSGASTEAAETRYETLRSYQDYVSAVYPYQGYDGTAYYHESTSDGRSLLMSFDPASGVDYPGFWGVLTDLRDASNAPGSARRLELTVLVLAELDDYPDRGAVVADLEV